MELGPGRGTMAKDVIQTINKLLSKLGGGAEMRVNFVEISPLLAKKQADLLNVEIKEIQNDSNGGPYMSGNLNGTDINWFRLMV